MNPVTSRLNTLRKIESPLLLSHVNKLTQQFAMLIHVEGINYFPPKTLSSEHNPPATRAVLNCWFKSPNNPPPFPFLRGNKRKNLPNHTTQEKAPLQANHHNNHDKSTTNHHFCPHARIRTASPLPQEITNSKPEQPTKFLKLNLHSSILSSSSASSPSRP